MPIAKGEPVPTVAAVMAAATPIPTPAAATPQTSPPQKPVPAVEESWARVIGALAAGETD